jgi:16S rRNA (uracil1498-N3)-methyltransferase
MPRFFIPRNNIDEPNGIIRFDRDNANHLTVLRHSIGDIITVCDGNSMDYECEIRSIAKNEAILDILHKMKCESEPNFKVTLFQGLPKSDKLELIIQKCVELGVYEIVPVITQNTIVRVKENSVKSKNDRYMKISEAAAKQCNRGIIPVVSEPISFDAAVSRLMEKETAFIAYENEKIIKKTYLTDIKANDIGIFIGPEGGFTKEEADKCIKSGIFSVSLGKRILRTETAGLAALAVIIYSKEGNN